MSKARNVWVFVEPGNHGKPQTASLELLSPGRKIADRRRENLTAVVIGKETEAAVDSAAFYGADEIIVIEDNRFDYLSLEPETDALEYLIKKYRPEILLIGATQRGREIAPHLACRFETGLTADCTDLKYDAESGLVHWIRPAYSGNVLAEIVCRDARPQMGTVRRGSFKIPEGSASHAAVIRENPPDFGIQDRIHHRKILSRSADRDIDLEGARIIVAGGKGAGPEGFKLIRRLADILGGEVGATRAAVDAGWVTNARMIGQSGRIVSPELYIACGISGAIHHRAGFMGAGTVLAIDKDKNAPVFDAADIGIVGDLFEVLPWMIEHPDEVTRLIEKRKNGKDGGDTSA